MKAMLLLLSWTFFLMFGCAGTPLEGDKGGEGHESGKELQEERLKPNRVEEDVSYY